MRSVVAERVMSRRQQMKATGRRAWRQAGRRFRKAEKRRGFTPSNSVGAFARRHWRAAEGNNGIVGKQFPPNVAKKPFTARSLVGMTMGARKRAYRAAVAELEQANVWRGDVVDRKRLRIGERLRRCPGCCNCQPCAGLVPKLCIRYCDGSGLLPARKKGSKP